MKVLCIPVIIFSLTSLFTKKVDFREVRGIVVDYDTKKPVGFSIIDWRTPGSYESGRRSYLQTDSLGRFLIRNPDADTIYILIKALTYFDTEIRSVILNGNKTQTLDTIFIVKQHIKFSKRSFCFNSSKVLPSSFKRKTITTPNYEMSLKLHYSIGDTLEWTEQRKSVHYTYMNDRFYIDKMRTR